MCDQVYLYAFSNSIPLPLPLARPARALFYLITHSTITTRRAPFSSQLCTLSSHFTPSASFTSHSSTLLHTHLSRRPAGSLQAGFAIDVLLEPTGGGKKVAKAFSYADRVQGKRVLFVAPDEWMNGKVRMKDLRKEDEKEVDLPFDRLVSALADLGIAPMADI